MDTRTQRHPGTAVRRATMLAILPILASSALFYPAQVAAHTALTPAGAANLLTSLPLRFEANTGQTDRRVKFLSRGPGYTLFLTSTEAVMSLRGGSGQSAVGSGGEKRGGRVAGWKSGGKQGGRVAGWQDGGKSQTSNTSSIHPSIHFSTLRMKLVNSNPSAAVEGLDEMRSSANYFIGSDPKGWKTNLAQFQKVRYEGVYPGIDLIYYGNGRQLEYDFIVQPGADPRAIGLDVQGADQLTVDPTGNLVIHTAGGDITWKKPTLYQDVNGVRKPIQGRYVIHTARAGQGSRRVSFAVASYDRNEPLTIDPALLYSTLLGGSGTDYAYGVAADNAGNVYVTGFTGSPGAGTTAFPTSTGAYQTTNTGSNNVFVTKIDTTRSRSASLVYSTYLGGGGSDTGFGIAVDSSGNAYITGQTNPPASGNSAFPTTSGAYRTTTAGGSDAFLTKLNSTGTTLLYSTYLGGSGTDFGSGVAVDNAGNAYVTGATKSVFATGTTPFPTTTNAYQAINGGSNTSPTFDAFVTKIDTTKTGFLSIVYSSYLGGAGDDYGWGIAADASGNAYITGSTRSNLQGGAAFPATAGALQPGNAGSLGTDDAFVTKIDTTQFGPASLVYSTYLGGSGVERGGGIAVDSSGNAYVTGYTSSTSGTGASPFPTTSGAFQKSNAGSNDAFVAKVNSTGTALLYSTYLGGSGDDRAYGIAVDGSGRAYVTGYTFSTGGPGNAPFPITTDAYQSFSAGNYDAFVTKIDTTQFGPASLMYSTYLGGSDLDQAFGIAVDTSGNAYVAGPTYSPGSGTVPFPTTPGAFQRNNAGGFDTFVTKIGPVTPPTFNSVGYVNLVLQNSAAHQVAFWLTQGANITSGAYAVSGGNPIPLPPNWQIVATGDFNGDGTTDLVLDNTSTGQIAFWFTSGNTITSGAYATANGSLINVPAGWQIVGSGDFNGDGHPALVLDNPSSGTIAIWTLNGTVVTSGAYVTSGGTNPIGLPAGWQIVGVGDFNGDGHPDLVLDNPTSGQIAAWLMTGFNVTSGVYVTNGGNPIPLPSGWQIAAIGDYNGDGMPDLVLQNLGSRGLAFWYLNGTALMGSSYSLSGGTPTALPSGWQVVGPR